MNEPFTRAELERIREQMPAARRVAYLNAGTLGPLPRAATDAMAVQDRYDTQERQSADHWDRLTRLQGEARGALASLTGVGVDQVALMHSTHEGLNACLWGLGLTQGDNVVTTDEEHPGLLVPLLHARTRTGCDARRAAWVDDDAGFVDGIVASVDERTRAVVVSHVSWLSGRVAPLRALRDALPSGVRLIVDGAQSAGVLAVDPADGWDAYTVSGQKWPCGPNGSGGLALADPLAWQPTFGAYAQLTSWHEYVPANVVADGRRFEMSQEALQPLAGFAASVTWLLDEVGLPRALAHARGLNQRAREGLLAGGIEPDQLLGTHHLLSIDAGPRAEDVTSALFGRGVLVRALGTDRVRISFGCWNIHDDVDLCVEALLEQLASPPVGGRA